VNYPAKPVRYSTSRVKITGAEAKSAIYLDYEGNKDKSPTLLVGLFQTHTKQPSLNHFLRLVLTGIALKVSMQKTMQLWSCA
jgi:hypothetical protein